VSRRLTSLKSGLLEYVSIEKVRPEFPQVIYHFLAIIAYQKLHTSHFSKWKDISKMDVMTQYP